MDNQSLISEAEKTIGRILADAPKDPKVFQPASVSKLKPMRQFEEEKEMSVADKVKKMFKDLGL